MAVGCGGAFSLTPSLSRWATRIDQGVITTATKRGLRPTAMPDITAQARTVFRLVNGVPMAFDADGQTVRSAGLVALPAAR